EWYPVFGNGSPAWHPGQCSQPSPDPVILTVAPEATITTSITALARDSRLNVRVETANRRTRGSGISIEKDCTGRISEEESVAGWRIERHPTHVPLPSAAASPRPPPHLTTGETMFPP